MMFSALLPSPLGRLRLVCSDSALVGLDFDDAAAPGESAPPPDRGGHPVLKAASDWLDRYFAGEKPSPSELPIMLCGSAYQAAVWSFLLALDYGRLCSYADAARAAAALLGRKPCALAAGQAVGSNPIAIIVPCHRVVGSNGALTGYGGGLRRKERLLTLEGAPFRQTPGAG